MSQSSITSYFNTRKRPATEELTYARAKLFISDNDDNYFTTDKSVNSSSYDIGNEKTFHHKVNKIIETDDFQKNHIIENTINHENVDEGTKSAPISIKLAQPTLSKIRSGRTLSKRVQSSTSSLSTANKIISKDKNEKSSQLKQQNLVQFIKQGQLSPRNKLSPQKNVSVVITSKGNATNIEKGMKIITGKGEDQISALKIFKNDDLRNLVHKELNFNEVKSKVTRSAKLQELKASINRLKELDKIRKLLEDKSKTLENAEKLKKATVNIKKFDTIELEVLTSPQKGFKTPTKTILTPAKSCTVAPDINKNELMTPKKTETPKRVLFSPTKTTNRSSSATKLQNQISAYERYQNLTTETAGKPSKTLQLPYKYRCLIEMFRCLDSVCAMFYNRKEVITFKKLKPAVQRMLRKNFTEINLAQIKHLYPDSYQFTQMKTRNFGSISKQDYFQLVITPTIDGNLCNMQMQKIDEDNVLKSAEANIINSQVLINRLHKFINILLNIAKDEHDKFLRSLSLPFIIPKEKVTRWHPEFDLENCCPDIPEAVMPQPPNTEKFSSAKDILSTARNLFNCATPMEKAMLRLEAKKTKQQLQENDCVNGRSAISPTFSSSSFTNGGSLTSSTTKLLHEETSSSSLPYPPHESTNPTTESILKNVPKALLDKIKAKQAAKMLDSMTRRLSEDREATKYSRLPDMSRHLRNVFIVEKKGVLPLDLILRKIENSYKTNLTYEDIEAHLKLIAKELPQWLAFYEIRKTIYLKLNRDMDLQKITEMLTNIANEKLK